MAMFTIGWLVGAIITNRWISKKSWPNTVFDSVSSVAIVAITYGMIKLFDL